MDIYCTNCGEPWDIGGLTPRETREVREGACGACDGDPNRDARDGDDVHAQTRAMLTAELGALLGDDVDGLASELDDAAYMGVF